LPYLETYLSRRRLHSPRNSRVSIRTTRHRSPARRQKRGTCRTGLSRNCSAGPNISNRQYTDAIPGAACIAPKAIPICFAHSQVIGFWLMTGGRHCLRRLRKLSPRTAENSSFIMKLTSIWQSDAERAGRPPSSMRRHRLQVGRNRLPVRGWQAGDVLLDFYHRAADGIEVGGKTGL
jgi:hypothetical protein